MHTQDFCLNSEIVRSLVLDTRRRGAYNYWLLWHEWCSHGMVASKRIMSSTWSCHVTNDVFRKRNSEHETPADYRMSGMPIVNEYGRLVQ